MKTKDKMVLEAYFDKKLTNKQKLKFIAIVIEQLDEIPPETFGLINISWTEKGKRKNEYAM